MACIIHFSKIKYGSAQLTGEAPGLQIRCEALKPSRVGSIPMHFRHLTFSYPSSFQIITARNLYPKAIKNNYKITITPIGRGFMKSPRRG